MAPAEKKKSTKASKSKLAVAPQRSIRDLLVKKKPETQEPNGNLANEDVSPGQGQVNTEDAVSTGSTFFKPKALLSASGELTGNQLEIRNIEIVQSCMHVDIVDITDDPSQPIKDTVPPTTLPLTRSRLQSSASKHSLLAGPSSQPSIPPQRSLSSDGGTRDDPIILLDSSPVKPSPRAIADPTKPTHSLFVPRKPPPQLSKSKHLFDDRSLEAPFPDAGSQHVRGPQSEFPAASLQLGRRTNMGGIMREPSNLSGMDIVFLNQRSHITKVIMTPDPVQSLDRGAYMSTVPQEHIRGHAAIAHVMQFERPMVVSSSRSQELWTDKWRPQRAEHVLGNEHGAVYLRDWLRALELHLQPRDNSLEPEETLPLKVPGPAQTRGVKRPRPRVVRTVEKAKRRKKRRIDDDDDDDDDDDWIVYDDHMVTEESEEDDVDRTKRLSRLRLIESSPAPPSSPPPAPDTNTLYTNGSTFASELHNTLLLAGPVGSGKTTAVYACAKELGWDVFEVYPGIGKRSGMSLDQLVGEVGKNHLVGKVGTAGKPKHKEKEDAEKRAFIDMFGKSKVRAVGANVAARDGTAGEPVEVDSPDTKSIKGDFGFVVHPENHDEEESSKQASASLSPAIRQSLILLEEVDILFEEDRGFWPAVISLIKDCRRPVILTCNDISLIPVVDLPLQSVLYFEACPPPVAASYLQALCLAEDHLVDRNSLVELCASTHSIDVLDMPDILLNPITAELPVSDLRRAIHQLQLSSPTTLIAFNNVKTPQQSKENLADWSTVQLGTSNDAGGDSLALLRRMDRHLDSVSYMDSFLTRDPLDTPEALAANGHNPSPDDEIGHTHLFNCSGASGALASYHTDEVILEDALRHSRGALEAGLSDTQTTDSDIALQTRALFLARVQYQSEMLDLLWPNVVPLQSHILPRPAVFLDYVPLVRHMAWIDDGFEKTGEWDTSIHPRSGRPMRGSARTPYERQLTLSERQREIISTTHLDGFNRD